MKNLLRIGIIAFVFGLMFISVDTVSAQRSHRQREARREYRDDIRDARREYREDIRDGKSRRKALREYRDDVRDARQDYRREVNRNGHRYYYDPYRRLYIRIW